MPQLNEGFITALRAAGNGAARYHRTAGGAVLKVSYLWGKLRVDKMASGFTIPLPAKAGGGGDIPTTPTN